METAKAAELYMGTGDVSASGQQSLSQFRRGLLVFVLLDD